MLITAAPTPDGVRFLRSRPGTGPTSRRDAMLSAEVMALAARVAELEKHLETQLKRIGQMQQQLDEMANLLKKIVTRS